VLRCYLTSFPAWGGPGRLGSGHWILGAYVHWLSTFAEALRGVTDIDILRRPFYEQRVLSDLFSSPVRPDGSFRDGVMESQAHEKMLIDYLPKSLRIRAQVACRFYYPGAFQSQPVRRERQWNEWFMEDAVSMWRAGTGEGKAQGEGQTCLAPLTDIGWVAMQHGARRCGERVWALFKSSRFAHSVTACRPEHLSAQCLGEALAIDSGYYPSYAARIILSGHARPGLTTAYWSTAAAARPTIGMLGRIDNYEEHVCYPFRGKPPRL